MRTFAFTAIGVVLASVLIAAFVIVFADPFGQPGETWTNNSLTFGHDLRLLNSGRYVLRSWYDIRPG